MSLESLVELFYRFIWWIYFEWNPPEASLSFFLSAQLDIRSWKGSLGRRRRPQHILDLGSGGDIHTQMTAQVHDTCTVADWDENVLANVKVTPNPPPVAKTTVSPHTHAKWIGMDGNLPFGDASFDAIFCLQSWSRHPVLYSCPSENLDGDEDVDVVIGEIVRTMASGAHLYVVDYDPTGGNKFVLPILSFLTSWTKGHRFRFFSMTQVVSLLKRHGLAIVFTKQLDDLRYAVVARKQPVKGKQTTPESSRAGFDSTLSESSAGSSRLRPTMASV